MKSFIDKLLWLASIFAGYFLLTTHFLACAKIGHWLGDPVNIPEFLSSIDQFLKLHIESTATGLLIIAWLLIVAVAAAAIFYSFIFIACLSGPLFSKNLKKKITSFDITIAWRYLVLAILISFFTLAIIPVTSHNFPSDPSMLKAGMAMSFMEFVKELTKSSFMVFFAAVFLSIFAGVISVIIKILPDNDGIWQIPLATLIAFALLIGLVIGGGPVLKPLLEMDNAPELKFFYMMFAFYALFSIAATAIWDFLRRNAEIKKSDEDPMK